MIKNLTNEEIYVYANMLAQAFQDGNQQLPIRINFPLQKNKTILMDLAREIEQERFKIAQAYGELNEEEQRYVIPSEQAEIVNKEISNLFAITQEVNLLTININSINENLMLSANQMNALMFMIEE